jgi:selenocysteine-specific elongation factor
MDFDSAASALQEPPDGVSALAARALKAHGLLELKGDKPVYVSPERFEYLTLAVTGALGEYHAAHASEAGMPLDGLLRVKALDKLNGKAARSFVTLLAEKNIVALEGAAVRLPNFQRKDDEAEKRNADALFAYCKKRSFQPPTLEEARAEVGANAKMTPAAFSAMISSLKNARRVALLPGEFLLTDEVEKDMMDVLLKIDGHVTLASVRDATNSSRKFIMPILEYFDSKGYTRRVTDPKAGDVRVVKRPGI